MSRELWVRENWEEYVKEEEERERIRHAESGNARKPSNKMVFILTPPFTFDGLGKIQHLLSLIVLIHFTPKFIEFSIKVKYFHEISE